MLEGVDVVEADQAGGLLVGRRLASVFQNSQPSVAPATNTTMCRPSAIAAVAALAAPAKLPATVVVSM